MSIEPLWTARYRPKNVGECILPDGLKKTFQAFAEAGSIPNMLLSGPAGGGKCLGPDTFIDLMVDEEIYEKLKQFVE